MKAFVLKEPGVVGWYNAPEPELTPYGAILKPVAVTPCSSDVHTVFGGGSGDYTGLEGKGDSGGK